MDQSRSLVLKRVTQGNHPRDAGPQVMLKVEFTCIRRIRRKSIDYIKPCGCNKGKARRHLRIRQRNLKFCVAAPVRRVLKVESAKGDGRALTVWKRA